jgi:hypothetical protein
MRVENHCGTILTGKTEEVGDKPVPVLLYSPQTPHRLTRVANPDLRGEWPATNSMSHGTLSSLIINFMSEMLQSILVISYYFFVSSGLHRNVAAIFSVVIGYLKVLKNVKFL